MAKYTDAQCRASEKYHKKNIWATTFKWNIKYDKAAIAFLRSLANKQGYIKGLIEKDLKEKGYRYDDDREVLLDPEGNAVIKDGVEYAKRKSEEMAGEN